MTRMPHVVFCDVSAVNQSLSLLILIAIPWEAYDDSNIKRGIECRADRGGSPFLVHPPRHVGKPRDKVHGAGMTPIHRGAPRVGHHVTP